MDEQLSFQYGKNDENGCYSEVNGTVLYYEIYGTGDPLLLIHGNGSSIAGVSYQIDHFRKDYRVMAADSRGHGRSGLNTTRLTYEQIACDLTEMLRKEGIDRLKVFGWSDGGIVGLYMAIMYPELIDKLAVMGANYLPSPVSGTSSERDLLERAIWDAERKFSLGMNPEFWERKLQQLHMLQSQPDIGEEKLSKIRCPVLVMAGSNDQVRPEHTRKMHELIPGSELVLFSEGDHFMPIASPVEFNRVLEEFLRG